MDRLPRDVLVGILLDLPLRQVFKVCRRVCSLWNLIILSDVYCERAAAKYLPENWICIVEELKSHTGRPKKPPSLNILPARMRKHWRQFDELRRFLFGAIPYLCQECCGYYGGTVKMRQVDQRFLCKDCRRLPEHHIISLPMVRTRYGLDRGQLESLTALYVTGSNNQQFWEDDSIYYYRTQVEALVGYTTRDVDRRCPRPFKKQRVE